MKNYIIAISMLCAQNLLAQKTKPTANEPIIDVSIAYEYEQANIKDIQSILQNQTAAWNKGDIDLSLIHI